MRSSITAIPAETRVLPGARTLRLEREGATRAVLVLHGFTGYVGEMRFLAEYLHQEGFSVLAPRLPGHGTNNRDFRASGSGDWWRASVEAYLELASRYDQVMVTGLSMGGVLSALLASRFPLARAALLAPALDISNPLVPLTPFLRYLVPPLRKPEKEPDQDPEREYLAREYWNWQWPRETAELYRLVRLGRRALGKITCPTLTVVSAQDDTVPLAVARRIERSIAASERQTLTLEESGHVITDGPDRERVARAVAEWFLR
ncbi:MULTISPECIES: alpha/beta hydrolase [Alkalispirochaeta]|uniref:alpha/beta hydrolase n=1 Tax=Alkalispirochaeta sphaeroplastigenens TaxID=1187066 RepID=UPI0012FD12CE|nr:MULTISPECIES: alpha/beta fold hydrolase [Alkalispirochaeta]